MGLLSVLVLGAAMVLLPRRYATVPMILMACVVGPAQRIVFVTLDFNLIRILILFGWMRLLLRHELRPVPRRALDTVVVLWVLAATSVFVLYHGTWPMLVNRLGFMFDALGLYFLFRLLLRDWDDVLALARGVAAVSIPVAVAFLIEKSTGRNMFHVFGGVPEFAEVRGGTFRCQGPFAHPILAGAFWVALGPIMTRVGAAGARLTWLAAAGIGSTVIIVACSASSTPIGAGVIGLLAMLLFPFRQYLRWFHGAAALGLICLQMSMSRPIWHVLARIDFVGGSTSWYRYKLLDEFFRHVGDWWLAGTDRYADWWEWGLEDLTNQYVQAGLEGGLLTLILFLITIGLAFHGVGRGWRTREGDRERAATTWVIGVMLLLHATIFVGVSYFGQNTMLWYLALALAAFVTPGRAGRVVRVAASSSARRVAAAHLLTGRLT
ncbi:MAG: hypothetical protein ACYTGG_08225 [Planctomycetota bacterium]